MPSNRKPNFFIVGAAKSATTSMNYYLDQHPDIFMCPVFDTWHFITDMATSANYNVHDRVEYERLFEHACDEKIVGEKSVFYLYSPSAAKEIYNYNSESLILAILRHPVDVMFSLHRQFVSSGNDDIYSFEDSLEAESDRRDGSRIPKSAHFPEGLQYRRVVRFADQIRRYFDVFGRERVMVMLYDDIQADLQGRYRDVLQFLEVEDNFIPDFAAKNVTAEKKIRNLNVRRLIKHNPIARLVARSIPRSLRGLAGESLSYINPGQSIESRSQIPSGLRDKLTREIETEIYDLADTIERDLSAWLPGRHS